MGGQPGVAQAKGHHVQPPCGRMEGDRQRGSTGAHPQGPLLGGVWTGGSGGDGAHPQGQCWGNLWTRGARGEGGSAGGISGLGVLGGKGPILRGSAGGSLGWGCWG